MLDPNSKVQKNEATRQRYVREMINKLSNSKEGFNALHFAAFRGEIEMVRLFEKYGGDYNVKSKQGNSVMHLASQGDAPNVIKYYLSKGMDIDEMDD